MLSTTWSRRYRSDGVHGLLGQPLVPKQTSQLPLSQKILSNERSSVQLESRGRRREARLAVPARGRRWHADPVGTGSDLRLRGGCARGKIRTWKSLARAKYVRVKPEHRHSTGPSQAWTRRPRDTGDLQALANKATSKSSPSQAQARARRPLVKPESSSFRV